MVGGWWLVVGDGLMLLLPIIFSFPFSQTPEYGAFIASPPDWRCEVRVGTHGKSIVPATRSKRKVKTQAWRPSMAMVCLHFRGQSNGSRPIFWFPSPPPPLRLWDLPGAEVESQLHRAGGQHREGLDDLLVGAGGTQLDQAGLCMEASVRGGRVRGAERGGRRGDAGMAM